jgi:hypothetical protein
MALLETTTFRLAPTTDEAAFLDADRRIQTEFLYHQPGLLRRTTARGGGGEWVVVVVWQSESAADAAAQQSAREAAVSEFTALVDQSTVRTARYSTLD